MEKKRELKAITGMRFFAAIHVVLFHNYDLWGNLINKVPASILTFLDRGYTAVTFFFILSGFILSYVYHDQLSNSAEKMHYLFTRLAKLYPLYLIGLLLDTPRVAIYFFNTYKPLMALLKFFICFIVSLLMLQAWIPNIAPVFNSPSWSLSCEIFFYICLMFILKKILNTKYQSVGLFISFFTTVFLFYFLKKVVHVNFLIPINELSWRIFPAIRIFEFIFGIFLYSIVTKGGRWIESIKNYRALIFWICIACSIGMTMTNLPIDDGIYGQLILLPFFALIIICAYWGDFKGSHFLESKYNLLLGNASYAIYILHQPLRYYFERIFSPSILMGILYYVSLLIVSVFSYKLLEEKYRKSMKDFLIKKYTKKISL